MSRLCATSIWHLEKQDPDAPLSPPKKPIVFWIENAVPVGTVPLPKRSDVEPRLRAGFGCHSSAADA